MRHALDCAVLTLAQHQSWLSKTVHAIQQSTDRLVLHHLALSAASAADPWPDSGVLQQCDMPWRRFDVLILPVTVPSLAWTRKVLTDRAALDIPILLLCHRVSLLGINDLLRLGANDFACTPLQADEMRLRCLRAIESSPSLAQDTVYPWPEQEQRSPLLSLQEPSLYGEPFQAAKAKVVTAFEQRYLNTLLQTHHGNISRAARAARKNRRAFWELLRKHEISAALYKSSEP